MSRSTAIISIGSCLGDSAELVGKAVSMIAGLPGTAVSASSSLYETEAVDVPDEYRDIVFINAAVAVETGLSPEGLLDALHGIEAKLGRVRDGVRHSPRTIDLDIVAYGDETRDAPELTLPHPEALRRRFVMAPIAEMMPGFVMPGQGMTAAEVLATLPERPYAKRIELTRARVYGRIK